MRLQPAVCFLVPLLFPFCPPQARAQSPDQKQASRDQEAPGLDSRTFELLIVGPDGKPVPKAEFEIRLNPKPKEWVFHRGEPTKAGRYGKFAVVDEAGAAAFEIPSVGIHSLEINVTTPGFGPFWAQWHAGSTTAVIPESYTIHLDAGVAVGGVTVDDEGRPIAGVEVSPSIEFKKREGDLSQLRSGATIKSDQNGRWVYRSVPAAFEALSVSLDHPEYMGAQGLTLPLKEYTVAAGTEPSRKIVVPRGETVAGKVTSADGKPIAGAHIRTKFSNLEREAVTDENGQYYLKGCSPGSSVIFATAKTFGPETANVNIRAEMPAVDFQLPPGRTIRIRAVDSAGKPLPKFRVFFRRWRTEDYGYGLGLVLAYANEQGVWEWKEAPADAFIADICPTGRTQLSSQSLIARNEDYVFTFTDASLPTTMFGLVTDRLTGKPIPEFRVVPGEMVGSSILWLRSKSFDGKDGKFYYVSDFPRAGYQFRIEADGYLTADSEYLPSRGGNTNIQVSLSPGEGIKSKVLLPSGDPAVRATVVIGVAGTQIYFRNGDLFEAASYCDRRTTDADGNFSFPSQVGRFEIHVVHPAGAATVAADPGEAVKPLKLTPWARVRGIVKVGRDPAADVAVVLDHQRFIHDPMGPNINSDYSTTSGKDGSFEWTRVFPGRGTVSKSVKFHVTSRGHSERRSHPQEADFRSGATTDITIGGTGRAVTAELQPPAGMKARCDWNFAVASLQSKAGRDMYGVAVGPEGKLRLDDIPAGAYTLSIELCTPSEMGFVPGPVVGRLRKEIAIPSAGDTPVELGTLLLGSP